MINAQNKQTKYPITHTNNNTNNNYMLFRYLSNGLSVFFNMEYHNWKVNKCTHHTTPNRTIQNKRQISIFVSIDTKRTPFSCCYCFLFSHSFDSIHLAECDFCIVHQNLSFSASSYCVDPLLFQVFVQCFFSLLFFSFIFVFDALISCW